MFDKIYKFFEETAAEAKAEVDEEEYLASYDATAGKILRGEEVKLPEDAALEQWACDDPVQKGILDALEAFGVLEMDIRRKAIRSTMELIQQSVEKSNV